MLSQYCRGVVMHELLFTTNPFTQGSVVEHLTLEEQDAGLSEAESERIYGRITANTALTFPAATSPAASAMLTGLLQPDANNRLGCHPRRGEQQLKEMEFLAHIDWRLAKDQRLPVPYVPPRSTAGTESDDKQSPSISDTIDPRAELQSSSENAMGGFNAGDAIEQQLFAGFDWVQSVNLD
jgi:hypothetical protein